MLEHYISVGQQRLRCGYTTGTCAAAAARASAQALLTGSFPAELTLQTPAGIAVTVLPENCRLERDFAECAVRKDGGEVEAITSATITSRAVCEAIADAQKNIK